MLKMVLRGYGSGCSTHVMNFQISFFINFLVVRGLEKRSV